VVLVSIVGISTVAFGQAVADTGQLPEVTFWGSYYALAAMGVVLTQAALIAGLLIQRERRQRAERALRRGQSDLQASYVRIRDLGGRLLNAQEAERARIARELHDDIGQQLCLLAIDLTALRGSTRAPAKELLYFSYVTLATLGYGDVVPLTDGVRSLAVLESLCGTIYMAILVARLIGLHLSQTGSPR